MGFYHDILETFLLVMSNVIKLWNPTWYYICNKSHLILLMYTSVRHHHMRINKCEITPFKIRRSINHAPSWKPSTNDLQYFHFLFSKAAVVHFSTVFVIYYFLVLVEVKTCEAYEVFKNNFLHWFDTKRLEYGIDSNIKIMHNMTLSWNYCISICFTNPV